MEHPTRPARIVHPDTPRPSIQLHASKQPQHIGAGAGFIDGEPVTFSVTYNPTRKVFDVRSLLHGRTFTEEMPHSQLPYLLSQVERYSHALPVPGIPHLLALHGSLLALHRAWNPQPCLAAA